MHELLPAVLARITKSLDLLTSTLPITEVGRRGGITRSAFRSLRTESHHQMAPCLYTIDVIDLGLKESTVFLASKPLSVLDAPTSRHTLLLPLTPTN